MESRNRKEKLLLLETHMQPVCIGLTSIAHSQPEGLSAGVHFRVDSLKIADGRWWFRKTAFGCWGRWQLSRSHCLRVYSRQTSRQLPRPRRFCIHRQASSCAGWHRSLLAWAIVPYPILRITATCYSQLHISHQRTVKTIPVICCKLQTVLPTHA